jgi:glycosyltransferase involved in cell wall biosynthesis
VAVVIPCWNAELWIARAIQSVIDQNYPNLEIIVIDDGSTDNSLAVIKSFGDQIQWETGSNQGACAARNRGFELSDSRYVLFLDADDYLQGDFLLGLSKAVGEKRPDPDMVFGPHVAMSENESRAFDRHEGTTKFDLASSIVKFEGPISGSILWRREFLLELGCWDTKLERLQDYFLVLRALSRRSSFALSHLGTCVYWNHEGKSRISRRRTSKSELSVLHAYVENIGEFEHLLTDDAKLGLAQRLYFLALELYRRSHRCEAKSGFALCRSLGLKGHQGNLRHRILCEILGLDLKERISISNRYLKVVTRSWLNRLRSEA